MPARQDSKVLQGEPGDVESGFDGLLAEGFEEETCCPSDIPVAAGVSWTGCGPGFDTNGRNAVLIVRAAHGGVDNRLSARV